MLGFSIGKLLVLAVILFVVVFAFRLAGRVGAPRRPAADDRRDASRIDTVYDPESDTYVAKPDRRSSKKH